ncbi:hypothetical protein BO83DRAFT_432965 [Aspergillus eucalypticola CBS 122712]|uniref:Uncharacterized protein n=1 Tax=Aspergillus eucalypticola (strain CBS 122712 / IBT 29274) TaxID=1448314 RepID=A0A317UKU2_ASPEC|nr:uncharacterized protein BO83DRAFT_432965 [Aspergillus eucalypticola CBS 122712]PWY61716.1 hypothetical protein BO83DRAFT_432965 [Aspergillus eucalypticola CBS 122712]
MTCKQLYAAYGPIPSPESLQHHGQFAPIRHGYGSHTFVILRWKALRCLENDRWQACFRCLLLHPPALFPIQKHNRNPTELYCNLGPLAGIVDICPCKKITFHDAMDLLEVLRIRQRSLGTFPNQLATGVSQRFCWHSCTQHYGSTQLEIAVYPTLGSEDQLVIRTEYQLSTKQGPLGLTPHLACAHRSLVSWLASVWQRNSRGLPREFSVPNSDISTCQLCNTTLKCLRTWPHHDENRGENQTYLFWTERNLGKASTIPDSIWAAQRIHPLGMQA